MFTERVAIADTNPNLRGTSTHRLVIGVIPHVGRVEPPEDQVRVFPTLRRIFLELSYEENENEPRQLEFTISNFDEIRNTLKYGEIPPELEFFNGGPSLTF